SHWKRDLWIHDGILGYGSSGNLAIVKATSVDDLEVVAIIKRFGALKTSAAAWPETQRWKAAGKRVEWLKQRQPACQLRLQSRKRPLGSSREPDFGSLNGMPSQQSNTDQQMSLRSRWSSSTSSRIASGSWSRCHRHSSRPALSPSPSGAA